MVDTVNQNGHLTTEDQLEILSHDDGNPWEDVKELLVLEDSKYMLVVCDTVNWKCFPRWFLTVMTVQTWEKKAEIDLNLDSIVQCKSEQMCLIHWKFFFSTQVLKCFSSVNKEVLRHSLNLKLYVPFSLSIINQVNLSLNVMHNTCYHSMTNAFSVTEQRYNATYFSNVVSHLSQSCPFSEQVNGWKSHKEWSCGPPGFC